MALTLTWETVTALAPELASISVDTQEVILAQVALEVSVGTWGSQAKADTAACWLARHMGALRQRGMGSPLVSSISVGGVSKTYSTPTEGGGGGAALSQTAYGAEYLRLVRLWLPRFAVAR